MKKVVLAYSGGLDTSVCIKWLRERYGLSVVTVTADVGNGVDLEEAGRRGLKLGAENSYVLDLKEEFAREYVLRALKAGAVYEGRYPLSSALSRPLIAKAVVEVAELEGADAVAHGCTGKGNDQVRFGVSFAALDPGLKVITPVRDCRVSREEMARSAAALGIPLAAGKGTPYSVDQNLWGRSIECGSLEDPWEEPPADAFAWTCAPEDAPDEPVYLTIEFDRGAPVALDDQEVSPAELIMQLNRIGGACGIGRIDHVENRLVGIKSREVYECPAAVILLAAHLEAEKMTLTREVAHFQQAIAQKYAELVYEGLWFSPLRRALDAFVDSTQEAVTASVRVKLFKGSCSVVGRRSPRSLYDFALATYDRGDAFDHAAAAGFISIWGLGSKIAAAAERGARTGGLPAGRRSG